MSQKRVPSLSQTCVLHGFPFKYPYTHFGGICTVCHLPEPPSGTKTSFAGTHVRRRIIIPHSIPTSCRFFFCQYTRSWSARSLCLYVYTTRSHLPHTRTIPTPLLLELTPHRPWSHLPHTAFRTSYTPPVIALTPHNRRSHFSHSLGSEVPLHPPPKVHTPPDGWFGSIRPGCWQGFSNNL